MYHPPQLNLDEKDGLKLTVVNDWNSLLSNERFHIALQEFIYICYKYRNSESIPIQPTHPDGSKGEMKNITFPYKNLYDKVFKYIVKLENETDISNENPQPVLDTELYPQLLNLPRYEQINNDIIINKTSRSLFAEASYAFALFYTCKELAILSGFFANKNNCDKLSLKNIIDHTASLENIFTPISREIFKPCYPYNITTQKNNNVLSDCFYDRIIAVKGSALQPEMYNILKDFLSKQNFNLKCDNSNVPNPEIELHKLWNPYLYIGNLYDSINVNENYLYNNVPASHYTGLLFSFIARGGIVKGNFGNTFTIIKDMIKSLSTKMNEIVSTYCTCLYCSIFPLDEHTPQYTITSIGDGSDTLGLFNIPNLGVICFNYSFVDKNYEKYYLKVRDISFIEKMFYRDNKQQEATELKKDLLFANKIVQQKRIESIMLNNSSMLHFCCFGNDKEDFTYIKSSKGCSGTTNDSYLDKLIYLKSNKNSNGFIPCENISDNDIILERDGENQLYKLDGKTVAKYDNLFHDFYYIEKHPQSVDLSFRMNESNSNSVDEVFACIIVLDKFSDVVIQSSQMFKDDEFLVSKETSKIIEQKWIKEEQRDKILSILKKEKCTVRVSLNPCFVGKRYSNQANGYRIVDVDCNYIPHWDSVQKECNVLSAEDNERKHVYAQIKVTEESGKENISIEIYSFVSPLISNLNLQFKDNLSETVRESFNENYTLILKNYTVHSNKQNKDIPSYNQVLAMLRCLGFLEAICINISQDENFFENKDISGSDSYSLYEKILKDAKCCDKTMEKRNLSATDCQIKNPIYYHRDSYQESDFPDNTKPFEEIKDFESMKNIFK